MYSGGFHSLPSPLTSSTASLKLKTSPVKCSNFFSTISKPFSTEPNAFLLLSKASTIISDFTFEIVFLKLSKVDSISDKVLALEPDDSMTLFSSSKDSSWSLSRSFLVSSSKIFSCVRSSASSVNFESRLLEEPWSLVRELTNGKGVLLLEC